MSNAMHVSVVIVTRNRSPYLLRCLRTISAQSVAPLEIIVVDNASSDDTPELVRAQYPQAIVLAQATNTGAPGGRNIGIRHARGELCLCIDDDAELIDTQTIEKAVRYFADAKLACLSMHVIDQHGQVVTKLIPRRDRRILTEDTPGAMFSATGCVIRRSAFMEVGGFWEDLSPYFGEEPELSYRLLDKGYSILLTPHLVVRHHETPLERHASRRIYCGTRNTPWMALRNLPWYAVIGLSILTWGYFFLMAVHEKQLSKFFCALHDSIRHMPTVYRMRRPIALRTQLLIWKHSGLILF